MDWFETNEGKDYLENRLDEDLYRYSVQENLLLSPDIASRKMLKNIELSIGRKVTPSRHTRYVRKKNRWWLRIAAILVMGALISVAGYWNWSTSAFETISVQSADGQPSYHRIYTDEDQQRRITLGDGTRVRLNSNSILEIPDTYPIAGRHVRLKGEAYFQVTHDVSSAFMVQIEDARIEVLGTEFNVKEDTRFQQVQVAVVEGKVSLSSHRDESGRGVLLTKDTFAALDLSDGRIVMEHAAVDNYLSWITGKLQFFDVSLKTVSTELSRIYGVRFNVDSSQLDAMRLSAEIMEKDLHSVLDVISKTLGIHYDYNNGVVNWRT